jgi:hypothetical protein
VNDVYSLIHITLMFFIRCGNHKFYIQFLRLLRLQSFRVTLYKVSLLFRVAINNSVFNSSRNLFAIVECELDLQNVHVNNTVINNDFINQDVDRKILKKDNILSLGNREFLQTVLLNLTYVILSSLGYRKICRCRKR